MTEAERQAKFLIQLLPRDGTEHEITSIRELAPEEAAAIERAHGLVLAMARSRPYTRCVEIQEVAQAQIAEFRTAAQPAPGQIESLRAAFGSLRVALGDVATELLRWTTDDAFLAAVEAAEASRPWADVGAVADPAAGAIVRRRADSHIVWMREGSDEVVPLAEMAFVAVQIAQQLLVAAFRTLGGELEAAAVRLRQLSVETPAGIPGIVELPVVDGQPVILERLSPTPLAVAEVSEALRALRIARAAADTPSPNVEVSREPRTSDPTEDAPEQPVPVGPVEISSLFRLARTLGDNLERTWSDALDEARLRPALHEQAAGTMSLLHALQRQISTEARVVKEWPLSLDGLLELEVAPSKEATLLGQLEAVERVTRALRALTDQTVVKVTFDEAPTVERLWDAGAFAILHDDLHVLERLSGENEADNEGLDHLTVAARAIVRGDPEAGVLHALLAAADFLGVPPREVPSLAAEKTLDRPERKPFTRQTFERALELLDATMQGRPNLAVALMLAPLVVRAASALIHAPLRGGNLTGTQIADLIEADHPYESLEDDDA